MVKYCSRVCQLADRSQHKEACKKRASEIYDEALFKDLPPAEDCPICMLPLPLEYNRITFKLCCWQNVCDGCTHAQFMDSIKCGKPFEDGMACPFCRSSKKIDATADLVKKGMDNNKAEAFCFAAQHHIKGKHGFPRDLSKAMELYQKAGELGDHSAYDYLGLSYSLGLQEPGGKVLVELDMKKARHYYELAAIGGCISARLSLGQIHDDAGDVERAFKHFMIGARAGDGECFKKVKKGYERGFISKDNYTATLRAYQKQQDDRKSAMRDEAIIYNSDRSLYMQHIDDTCQKILDGRIDPR